MKQSLITPIMEKLARQMGVKMHIERRYQYVGQIALPDGRKRYFRGTNFDLNTLGSSEIARDKDYAAYFMKLMGYPQVKGQSFFTERWCKVIGSRRNPDAAYRYARRLGLPVIVKPNSKSQGSGVCKVHNKQEFMQAVRALSKNENVFLVQKVAQGRDYRIVVLDDEIISAYQRLQLAVTGDGRSTVLQLLKKKQRSFKKTGRDTIINLKDFRMRNQLRKQGLSMRSVPSKGTSIELLANANLSTGGDAIDVTQTIHPEWRKLAIRLTNDMGLRYCGVDVMVDGTLKEPPKKYVVLEINAAPGLDHYASVGAKQLKIVENMYGKVLKAMLL